MLQVMKIQNEPTCRDERQERFVEGAREGIRSEVKKIEDQGLPIIVSENGKVVDLQLKKSSPRG